MKRKAVEWRDLTRREQREALDLIRGEQLMWRTGKGTNWDPPSLPVVKMRYRVLGAAIAVLRAAGKKTRRGEMTSRDFCYWLQGFFELSGGGGELTQTQAGMVRKHLALVFKHEIDPSMGGTKHQDELNKTHGDPLGGQGMLYRC